MLLATSRTRPSAGDRCLGWLVCAVIALVALAGYMKLWDMHAFVRSLVSWTLVPGEWRTTLAWSIAAGEASLGTAWLIGVLDRARGVWIVLCLVATFTLVYTAHLAFGAAPECRCFGPLMQFEASRDTAVGVVGRNLAMIGVLSLWLWRNKAEVPRRISPVGAVHGSGQRAFTLIEILLCVALIGILAAMLLPAIRKATKSSGDTRTLALLGQHSAAFQAYTSDWKDYWPAVTDPKATWTILRTPDFALQIGYFDIHAFWHVALSEGLYREPWRSPAFSESPDPAAHVTSLWYSSAFLADPAFWNYDTRTGPEQWRATRATEVVYPDRKAVMFASRHYLNQLSARRSSPSALLGFVDGSAANVPHASLREGYKHGTGHWQGSGTSSPWPGMVTIDGPRGRDRR